MEYIQSNQNTKIKAAKKLTVKKNQRKENTYLLEGWHLVQEAIQNKAVIRQTLRQKNTLMNAPYVVYTTILLKSHLK